MEAGQASAFDSPPPSILGLEWVMKAFLYLDVRRGVQLVAGMGGGGGIVEHLQVSEIEAYCRMMNIRDRYKQRDLLFYIGVLDDVAVDLGQAALSRKAPRDPDEDAP